MQAHDTRSLSDSGSGQPQPRAPSAQVWAPADVWRSHVRLYGARDTRGSRLDEAGRHNRFAAIPYCAIHWFLEGQAEIVRIGTREMQQAVPRWSVSGCFNLPVSARNPGDVHAFTAVFFPEAFHALFGLDLSALQNRVVDAAEVLPPSAMAMMAAVAEAVDHEERQALIEAYLAGHAAPRPDSAWQRLRELTSPSGSRAGLDLAARLLGVGPRQVQRLFKRELGLSLRDFLLLQRTEFSLMQVCQKVRNGEAFNWVEHAVDAGYADQPHMVRDVKARTGRTPGQLAHDRLEHEADWMYRLDIPEAFFVQANKPSANTPHPNPLPQAPQEGPQRAA